MPRKNENFDQNYAQAKAFYEKFLHLNPKRNGEYHALAWFVDSMRKDYAAGKLSKEQIAALEAIGMDWDPRETDFQWRLLLLRSYSILYGNASPPRNTRFRGIDLGTFVHSQKQMYYKGTLDPKHKKALEEVGVVFEPPKKAKKSRATSKAVGEFPDLEPWQKAQFHAKYEIAIAFRKEYGHLYIPAGFTFLDVKIGDWLNTQRRKYRMGTLHPYYVEKLNEIGIDWNPGQKPKPTVPNNNRKP